MLTTVARRFLLASEPVAAVAFWAPEVAEEYAALGMDALAGYFCARSAGMGRATPAAVAAAFFNFAPPLVEQSLRWGDAEPAAVARARARGAARALQRLLGCPAEGPAGVGRVNELLERAVAAARPEGRMLFAATASLERPVDPLGALWWNVTLLREFRGDGHVVVLISHGISGPEALVLHAGYAGWSDRQRNFLLQSRFWPPEVYEEARTTLRARGFLDDEGALTDGGEKFREMIEMETDRLATPPFASLGEQDSEEMLGALGEWSAAVLEQRGVPSAAGKMSRAPVR